MACLMGYPTYQPWSWIFPPFLLLSLRPLLPFRDLRTLAFLGHLVRSSNSGSLYRIAHQARAWATPRIGVSRQIRPSSTRMRRMIKMMPMTPTPPCP
jgi:hypothetical protein